MSGRARALVRAIQGPCRQTLAPEMLLASLFRALLPLTVGTPSFRTVFLLAHPTGASGPNTIRREYDGSFLFLNYIIRQQGSPRNSAWLRFCVARLRRVPTQPATQRVEPGVLGARRLESVSRWSPVPPPAEPGSTTCSSKKIKVQNQSVRNRPRERTEKDTRRRR